MAAPRPIVFQRMASQGLRGIVGKRGMAPLSLDHGMPGPSAESSNALGAERLWVACSATVIELPLTLLFAFQVQG